MKWAIPCSAGRSERAPASKATSAVNARVPGTDTRWIAMPLAAVIVVISVIARLSLVSGPGVPGAGRRARSVGWPPENESQDDGQATHGAARALLRHLVGRPPLADAWLHAQHLRRQLARHGHQRCAQRHPARLLPPDLARRLDQRLDLRGGREPPRPLRGLRDPGRPVSYT